MSADKAGQLADAIQEGSFEKVQQLLEEGADINFKMNFGWTPLLSAVQGDKVELVHFLLDQGADPCAKKDNGATPFIIAGITGNVILLDLFLSKGSKINEYDDNGFTALMEAARYGKEEALRFLHDRGADVNLRRIVDEEKRCLNKGGETALMDAARKGHFVIVKALVDEMGAEVNICDNQDRNAFVHALSVNKDQPWRQAKENVAIFLLEKGADTTKRGEGGKTTLILAVEQQSQMLVTAILEKDEVDINDADKNHQTALMVAVEKQNCSMVRLLCEKSSPTDIGNLIEIANRNYNPDMAKLLRQYGAKGTLCQVDSNRVKWTSSSKRWGSTLQALYVMYRPMIGKLKIFIDKKFRIQRISQGGVYLGFYDGDEVAVKVCNVGTENAEKERTCLEKCRTSNHLLKYYGSEEQKACLYLCFALCEENLEEYFGRAENTDLKSKDILKTIFQAVRELHAFGFGHQDLHPSNILIDTAGKVFLADFDKSKKLVSSDSEKNDIITEDLKGLERLILYVIMRGRTSFEDLPEQCPEDIVEYIEIEDLRARLGSPDEKTPASEQVGNLIQHPYFWSNRILAPFLNRLAMCEQMYIRSQTAEHLIEDGSCQVSYLVLSGMEVCLQQLLQLQRHSQHSNNVSWRKERECFLKENYRDELGRRIGELSKRSYLPPLPWKYRFLKDVGNETRNATEEESREILEALNSDQDRFKDWKEKIDKTVLDCMIKVKHPKGKKNYKDRVQDLLRFIRNIGEHLHEQNYEVKKILEKPEEYFLNRFPELTMHVYQTLYNLSYYKHFPNTQTASHL